MNGCLKGIVRLGCAAVLICALALVWWFRAPIETQAMMIEAFAEVAHDSTAVEDCKGWLLKQKQTRDWKTTRATADAVYALLLRGTDPLASEALVEVALGGQPVRPGTVEAGTGFYERRFGAAEITPAFATITVKKSDAGVAWGSVFWQYFEDMSRVRAYAGTPLTLKKALFARETGTRGAELRPITGGGFRATYAPTVVNDMLRGTPPRLKVFTPRV